mmetsp:Transcript_10879/g.16415  ORF Transcript_10879/g.16415 Transcript_10879/m.16415 type:complete len:141 (-) Transcript_10879:12-434(-)
MQSAKLGIHEIEDKETISDSALRPVPENVVHELYRTVEGDENYVVKLGDIKHAVTSFVDQSPSFSTFHSRVIPVEEPSAVELDMLLKYAADINKAGSFPEIVNEDGTAGETASRSKKLSLDEGKPLYSHIDGDILYEYFE